MHIFYSKTYDGKVFILDEAESIHLSRVLRLVKGDEARVINGSGTFYRCRVLEVGKKTSSLQVISSEKDFMKRDYYLHIAIAPTKSIDRYEWFIEKSVEMGIDRITPIICDRSERRISKTERTRKVIIAAMKQSLKASETIIGDAVPFTQFIEGRTERKRFIAHCNETGSRQQLSDSVKPGDDGLVLIGPEGDFTPDELDQAIKAGFKELSLGSSRLRTETAGVVACSMYYFINM